MNGKTRIDQTTNAIENVWRQLRRWLNKKNGLKKQNIYRSTPDSSRWHNTKTFRNPEKMVEMLVKATSKPEYNFNRPSTA